MKKSEIFKKIIQTASILLLTALSFLEAASVKVPTVYNAYDGFSPGARAMAMGYAFSPVADDPSTVYFNPAGLSTLETGFISMTVEASRQSDIPKNQLFLNEPISNSGVVQLALISGKGSFAFRPLTDLTVRESNGNDWSTSEIKINAYTFSAANKSESGVLTGLNISYLSGRIAQAKMENGIPSTNLSDGQGISIDLGFLKDLSKEVSVGLNFQNLLGTMWWDDFEKEQLPFCIRGGFAFKIPGYTIFATELEKRYYRNENPGPLGADETITHFGLEQTFSKSVKIRVGAYGPDFNDKERTRITSGIGYELNNYRLSLSGERYRISGNDVARYVFSFDIPI